jgi:hypothetical protein
VHRDLLPLDLVDFGAGGFGARIEPYRSEIRSGEAVSLTALVRNPFARPEVATVRMVGPAGWGIEPRECRVPLADRGEGTAMFEVRPPPGVSVRRARIAVDLTVGEMRFGQHAEALVTVR